MKNLVDILDSDFKSRLNWTLTELEDALQLIGENFSTKVKEVFQIEEDRELDHCSIINVYDLETDVWRAVKVDYPEITRPSYHIKIIQQMTEDEKKEYESKIEYAKIHFSSRAIEMKIRCYKAIDEAIAKLDQK